MPLQKTYLVKVLDQDNAAFLKTFEPGTLKNLPSFRSKINGGLGELILDLNLPFDDFDEGNSVAFLNLVDLYAIDADHPRGRRIYRGYVSRYEPYAEAGGGEGVRVTCLGLASLLTASYYSTTTHTNEDPETIGQAIVDHFSSVYGGSLLSYSGTTQAVGSTVTYTFTDQKWFDALRKTGELAGSGWWWKIDQDGKYHLKPKPASATHTLTIGKDIDSIVAPKDAEKVINEVIVRRSGGTATPYTDASSQATYGTGSPATGKRTKIVSDASIPDATTADARGNKLLADLKDAKVSARVTVNVNADLEAITVGDTVRIRNHRKGNTFFSDNMLIVSTYYKGDTLDLELEQLSSDFGAALAEFVSG